MIIGPVLLGGDPELLSEVRRLFHYARNHGDFDPARTEPTGAEWLIYAADGKYIEGFALVSYAGPGMAAIEPIYVVPSHRKKGIATALLNAAAQAAKGQGNTTIMLGLENGKPMQAIAAKAGFAEAGIIMTRGL